jgi:glycine dehydrogenase
LVRFAPRHNSTTDAEVAQMVAVTGFDTLEGLIDATVPTAIRRTDGMRFDQYDEGLTESQFLDAFK